MGLPLSPTRWASEDADPMEGEIVSVGVWRDESWSQLLYRGNEKAYEAGHREKSIRAGRH